MNNLLSFFDKKFVPFFGRLGSQKHLSAIRDGFVSLIPLLIAGSFATLINNLPFESYQNMMTGIFGDTWKGFGGNIWWGSFAVISLFISFSVAYNLAKSYEVDGLSAGLISLANFAILIPQAANVVSPSGEAFGAWGNINWGYTNSQGMFVALLVAIVSTEIFVKLSKSDRLIIRMPEGVPPAVSKSFAALMPGLITVSVFSLTSLFIASTGTNLFAIIEKWVASPLRTVADSFGSALVIPMFTSFLWFFGLHGANIIGGIIEPILLPLVETNMSLVAAGQAPVHIVTKPFLDAFVYLGGAGATLSLVFAMLIVGKSKLNKDIGKLALGPGLFNINEILMFGLPIVLNPIMFIPFIFAPVVLSGFSYVVISLGIVPKTIALMPWITPPIIGGFVATGSFAGSVLQIVNLGISTAIYVPFVIISDRIYLKQEKGEAIKESKIS